mmetsp:Transcript_22294/g.62166  ORF Transcript_22294/g.62166 Transcript_22294/m.62166 type:complete len:225 (-) Transcript_22294:25-699(-)
MPTVPLGSCEQSRPESSTHSALLLCGLFICHSILHPADRLICLMIRVLWDEVFTRRCPSSKEAVQRDKLAELHGALLTLASLESVVQERAGLLVASVVLEAIEEHLLVLGACSLNLLLLGLRLSASDLHWLLRGWLLATSGQGTGGGSDRTVGDGRSGTECHTLGDGGSDSGKHATSGGLLWLHWRRCGCAGSTGWWCSHWATPRWSWRSTGCSSSSSALHVSS